MHDLRIENAWICSINSGKVKPVFGDLIISNGIISEIVKKDFTSFLSKPHKAHKNSFNVNGAVITIPLVNFHEHFYSRLAKGLNIKGPTDNFINILHNLWWKLDRALTSDMVEASVQMGAIESIKNGVLYTFDHHASMTAIENSLDIIAQTTNSMNLNSVLCFEATDRNGSKIAEASLNENIEFLKRNSFDNIKTMLGLHASFTLSDETLIEAERLAADYDLGIHIHLCEDSYDRYMSREVTGKYPVQRLKKYNLLNDKSILAHGIYLTENDCKIIDEYGPAIAFNPDSNMNNNVGTPDLIGFPESIPMLMGTDGMHANPGKSLKNLFLLMRAAGLSFDESFHYVNKIYFDQTSFVKKYFDDYPSLKKGDKANFVVWDYVPPTPLNSNNFFGQYIYGILERAPDSVVKDGEFLLKNKQLQNLNEEEINKNIYKQGEALVKKFSRMK